MSGASRHHEALLLGVFETPSQIPGGKDVQCPICGEHSPPAWGAYYAHTGAGSMAALRSGLNVNHEVSMDWMRCSNEECEQLIIRVHEQGPKRIGDLVTMASVSWVARPRFGEAERPIDPLVPEPFRTDYGEAAAILDISHRMSAVLARRILGDLLKKYAGKDDKRLTVQIDAFTEESGHPSGLTENLHHFREVGDFAAHTQEDQEQSGESEPTVIDVDREEAEWTLDLVDRLFDYFIVAPAKDERIKRSVDDKTKRAGRRALRPGTEEEQS
jgi:hypothetical protein